MTRRQLNRELAAATGESVRTIARCGFTLLESNCDERDREPLVVDWDELNGRRQASRSRATKCSKADRVLYLRHCEWQSCVELRERTARAQSRGFPQRR